MYILYIAPLGAMNEYFALGNAQLQEFLSSLIICMYVSTYFTIILFWLYQYASFSILID